MMQGLFISKMNRRGIDDSLRRDRTTMQSLWRTVRREKILVDMRAWVSEKEGLRWRSRRSKRFLEDAGQREQLKELLPGFLWNMKLADDVLSHARVHEQGRSARMSSFAVRPYIHGGGAKKQGIGEKCALWDIRRYYPAEYDTGLMRCVV